LRGCERSVTANHRNDGLSAVEVQPQCLSGAGAASAAALPIGGFYFGAEWCETGTVQ